MSFATSPHDSPRRALLIGWLRYALFTDCSFRRHRGLKRALGPGSRRPSSARSNGVLRDPTTVSHDAKGRFGGPHRIPFLMYIHGHRALVGGRTDFGLASFY